MFFVFHRIKRGIAAQQAEDDARAKAAEERIDEESDKIEEEKDKAAQDWAEAEELKELEAEKLLTPKELATKRKEPWVDVIGFKVNPDDIRFGFFEIDWNDLWVLKLKQEGYGADGDPDDEITHIQEFASDIHCHHFQKNNEERMFRSSVTSLDWRWRKERHIDPSELLNGQKAPPYARHCFTS